MAITDSQLQNDAVALLDSIRSNGCPGSADASVRTFQQSYNDAGAGSLAVDGLYGPNTSAALQAVINSNQSNAALGGMSAPGGCVGSGGGGGGGGGSLPPVVVSSGGGGTGPLPYIIGAVVVAGALAAYTYSKKKHKRH